jgi:aspartate racemase
MPTISPPGGVVDWPENEGVLGVVGVAPWATIEFCKVFYSQIEATKDWHYPRVITDINTKIPSRGRHLQLGEADPSPAIAASIAELYGQGATVVVVPCNTAHLLYDRWAGGAAVPVPNIVIETLDVAFATGAKKVCSLTSEALAKRGLYSRWAEAKGMQCFEPSTDEQRLVSVMIEEVKIHGQVGAPSLAQLDAFAVRLIDNAVDAVLIGCTELSILSERISLTGVNVVDSNHALANAALRLVRKY